MKLKKKARKINKDPIVKDQVEKKKQNKIKKEKRPRPAGPEQPTHLRRFFFYKADYLLSTLIFF